MFACVCMCACVCVCPLHMLQVRRCLESGRMESDIMPHAHSRLFMEIMDELRRQVGYSLPQDSA